MVLKVKVATRLVRLTELIASECTTKKRSRFDRKEIFDQLRNLPPVLVVVHNSSTSKLLIIIQRHCGRA